MAILILVIYLVFKKPIRSLIGRFKKWKKKDYSI
jgi:hypothetical protein